MKSFSLVPTSKGSSARVQDHLGLARWLWPIGPDLWSRRGDPRGPSWTL